MRWFGIRRSPWQVARLLWKKLKEIYAFDIAAELSYYFLFSLFPFLLFLVALAGFLPIEGTVDRFVAQIGRFAPAAATELIEGNLRTLTASNPGGLISFSVVLTLWASSNAFMALIRALNRAYGVRETRSWWKVRGLSILLVIASGLGIAIGIGLLVLGGNLGHRLAHALGLHTVYHFGAQVLRWPMTAAVLLIVFASIYAWCPNLKLPWKFITPGSAMATVLWLGAAAGFSFYVEQFGRYSITYGSLGAVIVLLLWLYLTGLLLVVGGTLNAMLQHLSPEGKRELQHEAIERTGERARPPDARAANGRKKHAAPGEASPPI